MAVVPNLPSGSCIVPLLKPSRKVINGASLSSMSQASMPPGLVTFWILGRANAGAATATSAIAPTTTSRARRCTRTRRAAIGKTTFRMWVNLVWTSWGKGGIGRPAGLLRDWPLRAQHTDHGRGLGHEAGDQSVHVGSRDGSD